MDSSILISTLTEGLTAEEAAIVRKSIERDTVKTKVGGWKQETEYQELVNRATTLQLELDGEPDKKKLGAKAYRAWYEEHSANIQKLMDDQKKYVEKYGALDAGTPPAGTPPAGTPPTGRFYTEAEIQQISADHVAKNLAPTWGNTMAVTSKLIQRHMRAGRPNDIDFQQLGQLANEKYAGNLEQAYDEWDKPEREKIAKADMEKEVQRRVNEEVQKRGGTANFPAGADFGPSAMTHRTQDAVKGFDKTALLQEMVGVVREQSAA